MAAVKAPPLVPKAFASRIEEAAQKAGLRSEPFGRSGGVPLLSLSRRTPGIRPRIYLSAGVHGDEPAPPLALLSLVESGFFDSRATWFVCPMINPRGLAAGTRENPEGVDLNRDYRHLESPEVKAHVHWLRTQPNFDITLCLHEDWESKGFYLYEVNPKNRPSLASRAISAASAHCPIDLSPEIDGRPAAGGIIRPNANPLERERWPEAIYLIANHTTLSYTLESPSSLALDQRVKALVSAVQAAVEGLISSR